MRHLQGEKTCIRGFRVYIFFEILDLCPQNPPARQLRLLACNGQIKLSCLADGFYGLQSRIPNKMYFDPLIHAVSPCECLIERFFNFIQSSHSAQCTVQSVYHFLAKSNGVSSFTGISVSQNQNSRSCQFKKRTSINSLIHEYLLLRATT